MRTWQSYFCPSGTIVPRPCAPGGFCEQGVGSAQPCPVLTTSPPLSDSLSDCTCEIGLYNNASDGGVQCLTCPVGTACNNLGVTLASLPLKPGYYRPSTSSVDVRKCSDAGAGCGTATE